MKIIIRSKGLSLTPELQKTVEEKIGGLEKFAEIMEIFVDLEKETRHHKKGDIFRTEAQIVLAGKKLVASAEGDDIVKTIVEVKDKLQQEIKKFKLKNIETPRRASRKSQYE